MSQQNVEIAVKQFEGTNARDFAGVMDTWAEDVTLVVHAPERFGSFIDRVRGKGAVGEWFGDWFSQFALGYRFDIEELREAGDRVLVVARHHGHGRLSGVMVEQSTPFVYTLREGKVSRIEVWADDDRESAIEAAGLRE